MCVVARRSARLQGDAHEDGVGGREQAGEELVHAQRKRLELGGQQQRRQRGQRPRRAVRAQRAQPHAR